MQRPQLPLKEFVVPGAAGAGAALYQLSTRGGITGLGRASLGAIAGVWAGFRTSAELQRLSPLVRDALSGATAGGATAGWATLSLSQTLGGRVTDVLAGAVAGAVAGAASGVVLRVVE